MASLRVTWFQPEG